MLVLVPIAAPSSLICDKLNYSQPFFCEIKYCGEEIKILSRKWLFYHYNYKVLPDWRWSDVFARNTENITSEIESS